MVKNLIIGYTGNRTIKLENIKEINVIIHNSYSKIADNIKRHRFQVNYINKDFIKKTKNFNYRNKDKETVKTEAEEFKKNNNNSLNKNEIYKIDANLINNKNIKNIRFIVPIIDYKEKEVPILPYYLGYWLGDGTSASPNSFTIGNEDIGIVRPFFEKIAEKFNLVFKNGNHKNKNIHYKLTTKTGKKFNKRNIDIKLIEKFINDFVKNKLKVIEIIRKYKISISTFKKYYKIYKTNGMDYIKEKYNKNLKNKIKIKSIFQKLNLVNNKHIPELYLKNSRKNRLELLAGLLDSDGTLCGNTTYEITQKNKILSYQIVELCRSLGMFTTTKEVTKVCTNSANGRVSGQYQRMIISIPHPNYNIKIPVLLERKKHKGNNVMYPKIVLENNNTLTSQNKYDDIFKSHLSVSVEVFREVFKKKQKERIKKKEWKIIKNSNDKFSNDKFKNIKLNNIYYDIIIRKKYKVKEEVNKKFYKYYFMNQRNKVYLEVELFLKVFNRIPYSNYKKTRSILDKKIYKKYLKIKNLIKNNKIYIKKI